MTGAPPPLAVDAPGDAEIERLRADHDRLRAELAVLEGSTAIRVRNTLVPPLLGAVIRALLPIAKGLVPRRAVRER